ncbi:MAG: serine/threonine protein kinase [Phycisphaerales bacterium]|nr:serine/threonine protein kinase [Phycisphaerales bacterium]
MRITKGNPEIRVDRRRSEDDRVGEGYHAARRILASLAPTTPTSLTPPGYQLLDTLGVGGGGATFLALRDGSDRPVALKVLHAHAAPGPTRQRAWRELDLLQDTHLPCLPRLLDYGVIGDRLFITTEFVGGQRLDEHARAMPPSRDKWTHLAETLARVADAVHSLNERGIIHRDLKPSNILIASDGSPFIIDLGVAALTAHDAAETLTADGVPIGTPAFMSPEQARGERGLISIRSDVYALGATACAVLTGRTPHDLEGVSLHEAVRRVGSEPARDARALEPDLPRALAAIVAKACAAHPRERYATAAELAEDLRRFVRREPVLATRPGAWQRAVRWVGKHPVAATAILCAGMVVASGLFAFLGVRFLRYRPSHTTYNANRTSVRLISVAGDTLATWSGPSDMTGSVLAELLDRPHQLGGGRVLVTWTLPAGPGVSELAQVGFWDPSDLSRPWWQSPSNEPDLVQPARRREAGKPFSARLAMVDDFLPGDEYPGPEVLVVHSHIFSLRCIRLYNLRGDVVYSAWHDGAIGSACWLPGKGLLVFAGDSAEFEWKDLDVRHTGLAYSPAVFFAVRPIAGASFGLLNGPDKDPDPRARVEWYRCPLPPEAQNDFTVGVSKPHDAHLAVDHTVAELHLRGRNGTLWWTLDAEGRIVPGSFFSSDGARQAWDELRLGEVWLGDLPRPTQ